ncbi:MAG: hypothetical protein JNM66_08120 [Bryobacterales bacterium]|nr:hypothetical protein [Bryobacterales bacterium]
MQIQLEQQRMQPLAHGMPFKSRYRYRRRSRPSQLFANSRPRKRHFNQRLLVLPQRRR